MDNILLLPTVLRLPPEAQQMARAGLALSNSPFARLVQDILDPSPDKVREILITYYEETRDTLAIFLISQHHQHYGVRRIAQVTLGDLKQC